MERGATWGSNKNTAISWGGLRGPRIKISKEETVGSYRCLKMQDPESMQTAPKNDLLGMPGRFRVSPSLLMGAAQNGSPELMNHETPPQSGGITPIGPKPDW